MPFAGEADLLAQLRPGVDGLIIEDSGRRALFLPSVWEELPDQRQFLTQLKLKAGMATTHFSPSFHRAPVPLDRGEGPMAGAAPVPGTPAAAATTALRWSPVPVLKPPGMTTEQGPIGRAIPRREDRRFLTGTARFIDDLAVAGALHARFVRSPHAHARIVAHRRRRQRSPCPAW